MTHPLIRTVRARLREAASPDKAPQMQRYMKSAMPFRGVSSPEQRRVWREVFPAFPLTTVREWRDVALNLWRDAAYREERYAAIALTDLRMYAPYRTRAAIPMLEEMIVTGAWWDVVDPLATHHLGDVLRHETRSGHAPRMHALLIRWARDRSLWKRRAAILCQVRFKGDTDLNLLYECLGANLIGDPEPGSRSRGRADPSRDFFIRKAVGWALRQYAWVDPREVRRYVAAHRRHLSPLSVREALRNV